jgi:hypothetical protein
MCCTKLATIEDSSMWMIPFAAFCNGIGILRDRAIAITHRIDIDPTRAKSGACTQTVMLDVANHR